MINQLKDIKEQLFDAPREVKESFNNVVKYFGEWIPYVHFYIQYKEKGKVKYYFREYVHNRKEVEEELKQWKKDYPNWIDYSTAKIIKETDMDYYIVSDHWGNITSRSAWSVGSISQHCDDIKVGKEFTVENMRGTFKHKIVEGPLKYSEAEEKVKKISEEAGPYYWVIARPDSGTGYSKKERIFAETKDEAIKKFIEKFPGYSNPHRVEGPNRL